MPTGVTATTPAIDLSTHYYHPLPLLMSYDYTSLQIQQTLDQLESLAFSYQDDSAGLGLWDEDFGCRPGDDDLFDGFDVPAATRGMRTLDYEPDTDDYEYQQSRY